MGFVKKITEGAKGWNRRRQLAQGIRKSFYDNARKGMEQARHQANERRNDWFTKVQRQEGRKAKRRVFWREDSMNVLSSINNDAQNLIGRPLAKKIAKKAHIRTGSRYRRRKKPEMRLI
jgi:hypothetical protein